MLIMLKIFIRSEKSGYWNLHAMAISKMLNWLATTGHISYAKSAQLYLTNAESKEYSSLCS